MTMIHAGKCAKCESVITRVIFESVGIGELLAPDRYKGVSYHCPSCKAVLGVQMDPIAVAADTAARVKRGK